MLYAGIYGTLISQVTYVISNTQGLRKKFELSDFYAKGKLLFMLPLRNILD